MTEFEQAKFNLEMHLRGVAQEGIVDTILPSIAEGFKKLANVFKSTNHEEFKVVSKHDREQLAKWLDSQNYVSLSPIEVPVPVGMTGSYPEFLNSLQHAVDYCTTVEKHLTDFKVVTAVYLSTKDGTLSSSHNLKNYFELEQQVRELATKVTSHLDATSNKDMAPYGQVVHRNADWETVFSVTEKLVDQLVGHASMTKIQKLVDEIDDMLDKIAIDVSIKKLRPASDTTLMNLTQGSLAMAQLVEFVAVTRSLLLSLSVAVQEDVQHLIKM